MKNLRIKRIGTAILNFLDTDTSILDIGCGNGDLGTFLNKQIKIAYHGVDIIDFKVDNSITFTKSTLPYPFKDKSFNTVLLILTLHHFEKPEEGLKEAIRLAKNKILLLEDVPRNKIERKMMEFVDYVGNRMVSKEIPVPFNFYDDQKWKELFKKYNLKLNSRVNVYPLPFPRLNHFLYEVLL